MTNTSQRNLLALSQQAESSHHYLQSCQYLEEALRMGHDTQLVLALCEAYAKCQDYQDAYALIKEEADLFSKPLVFKHYLVTLRDNHYQIEAAQLKHLLERQLSIDVLPVSLSQQEQLMTRFRRLKSLHQQDYLTLYQLSTPNFIRFSQSLLLDPSQHFALRLALCSDLVKLGINQEIEVLVLDNLETFNPSQTRLLEHEAIYREVIASLGDKYFHNPSQLPTILGEINLVLGSLYPKLATYIDEPDSFASDFNRYLTNHDGGSHQALLDQIYRKLPRRI